MYVVDFDRGVGDLGVSVVVLATDRLSAVEEASKLFPEHRRLCERGHVYAVKYAEVDWQSGQVFIVRRRLRIRLPKLSMPNQQNGADAQKGESEE
jgi:hypothetical protein